MAKLNDPPPSAESIEALKRRFTRQNRDLARTNSAQSQRIRNLETEISRLLAENITFREAAIAAQKELEQSRSNEFLEDGIRELRDKLQKKLDVVAGLVEELGGLPDKARRKEREGRRRSGIVDLNAVRSPDERDWRNKQTISGVLGQDDGRLPPILEDKQYPRKTLEALEIQNLRHDAGHELESESPEVGPPPVASFDDMDVMIHRDPEKTREPRSDVESGDDEMKHLPSRLEVRRKRRTSSLLQDLRADQTDEDSKIEEKGALFRSGAKRKLDASDQDEPVESMPTTTKQPDDFVFQRTTLKPAARGTSSRFARTSGMKDQKAIIIPSAGGSPQKPRKVLGPKSTNSPTKRNDIPKDKSSKPDKEDSTPASQIKIQQDRSATRAPARKGTAEKQLQTNHDINNDQPMGKDLPPKTPATLDDILSPLSSEPSASHSGPAKRGAQEAAIINSVEDVLNGSIGRASRRAKSAISYAEPKLNVKMRRPGKELVGAIEGIDRKRDSTSFDRERSRVPSEDLRSAIKQEVDEEKWKGLPMLSKPEPTSPLSDKKTDHQDRAAGRAHSKRRTEVDGSDDALQKAVEKLSIFDPPDSPPTNGGSFKSGDGITPAESIPKRKLSTSANRRHSAAANSSILQSRTSDRPTLERPSSAASNRSDKAKDAIDLKRSTSVAALKTHGGTADVATRAERMASRRRSMMI